MPSVFWPVYPNRQDGLHSIEINEQELIYTFINEASSDCFVLQVIEWSVQKHLPNAAIMQRPVALSERNAYQIYLRVEKDPLIFAAKINELALSQINEKENWPK